MLAGSLGRIPAEIWAQVMMNFAEEGGEKKCMCMSLMLGCRKLYQLLLPHLYRHLETKHLLHPELLQLFKRKPNLALEVRSVSWLFSLDVQLLSSYTYPTTDYPLTFEKMQEHTLRQSVAMAFKKSRQQTQVSLQVLAFCHNIKDLSCEAEVLCQVGDLAETYNDAFFTAYSPLPTSQEISSLHWLKSLTSFSYGYRHASYEWRWDWRCLAEAVKHKLKSRRLKFVSLALFRFHLPEEAKPTHVELWSPSLTEMRSLAASCGTTLRSLIIHDCWGGEVRPYKELSLPLQLPLVSHLRTLLDPSFPAIAASWPGLFGMVPACKDLEIVITTPLSKNCWNDLVSALVVTKPFADSLRRLTITIDERYVVQDADLADEADHEYVGSETLRPLLAKNNGLPNLQFFSTFAVLRDVYSTWNFLEEDYDLWLNQDVTTQSWCLLNDFAALASGFHGHVEMHYLPGTRDADWPTFAALTSDRGVIQTHLKPDWAKVYQRLKAMSVI